jgi:glutathionylspermidine synthase
MSEPYEAFAQRIVASGILTDPWMEGAPRFQQEPVVLSAARANELARASEDVAAVYNEMALLVSDEPQLLSEFFCMTPVQQAMWMASAPRWHGIARADVFVTREGLAFSELNCDTPTGEAEAFVLGALALETPPRPGLLDPARELEMRFVALIEEVMRVDLVPEASRSIGLVYPTEFTEDLSLVRLYRRWLEARGFSVVLGSPYNLSTDGDQTFLFDVPVGLVLRHYKTDWWGERESVWLGDAVPDTEPLLGPLRAVLTGVASGKTTVLNPFGAVLPQNKRAMAFFWEHLHKFSPRSQGIIERHIPVTARLETMHEEQLRVQREDWVLKSDYGAEGDEVILGRLVSDEIWRASIAEARPGRWVAQRFFEAEAVSSDAQVVNHGVYLVAGQASGHYARVQKGPTDERALSAPVLIES